jgi:AraC-like DNA-binding protein
MEASAALEPWTNALYLDRGSAMTAHRYADRFSVVRVETAGALAAPVRKSSTVPALLATVFLRPIATDSYRLWIDDAVVAMAATPALGANVIDLEGEPAMWGGAGVDCIHFHVRRSAIDDTAAQLGYQRGTGFRLAVGRPDLVLAQIARTVLPHLGAGRPPALALDQLELIIASHLLQRYGDARPTRAAKRGGLAPWQRRRVVELLDTNIAGDVRLADLARACQLSVSHFARSFKASFGVTCHRWLTEHRIERAKQLLATTDVSLADVATRSGFADQAAFTRAFHRVAGVPPGQWRRAHDR